MRAASFRLDRVCATVAQAKRVSSCPHCSGTPLARLRHRAKWRRPRARHRQRTRVRAGGARPYRRHRRFHYRPRRRHQRPASSAPAPCARPERAAGDRCAPGHRAFARAAAITHASLNLRGGERVRGAVQVQNVNAYHSRFRQWLARFNGVASRYLPNHLGWQWAVDGRRIGSTDAMLRIALGTSNMKR